MNFKLERKIIKLNILVIGLVLLATFNSVAQAQVPMPEDVYGFKPGADYKLADYGQMLEYYEKLDAASDRVKKIQIGETVLGRPMILLFISTEENIKQLDKWQEISEKMSRARISDKEAQSLSKEGKAIVWIDGGMHSTELAHGQMTSELAYRIATEETEEMKKIRENVITLLMPVMNPDGLDIVTSWYRNHLGTPYETSRQPWLYHHYIGHDNNRDWFMNNMPETINVSNILYKEWFPQIVYNQHQTSPSWARIFVPPFTSPVNPNIHPGVTSGVNQVGSAMAERFALEGMPGVVSAEMFSMWWNGGGRTTPYYHNQIGILTETAHATPTPRYYDPKSMPKTIGGGIPTDGTDISYPNPWKGGESRFRDAFDYMITGSIAVLDYAADRKSNLLYNIYKMGKSAIEKGEASDTYAYVIPTKQWDEGEATNLVNILLQGGLEVKKATRNFTANGKSYAKGSYILYAGQSFRPYLVDLMEKQEYPTRMLYPGGPPETPYDLAGWTLPMQMGVNVERIGSKFSASTEDVTSQVAMNESSVTGNAKYGFVIDGKANASVKAVNILLKSGAKVSRILEPFEGMPAGAYLVQNSDESSIKDLGLSLKGLSKEPKIKTSSITLPKVGLYKSWVANMDEGWTRWLMDEYSFDIDTLHNDDIKNGDLSKYHSIIIPDQSPASILNGHAIQDMPEPYVGGLGLEGTLALKQYTEAGGTLIAFDKASNLFIEQFGLPLRNAVQGVSSNNFFIPGSLVRSVVNTDNPLAWGMQDTVSVSFNRSFAFDIKKQSKRGEGGLEDISDAPLAPVDVVVNYSNTDVLMSGWAIGENRYIAGKPAMVRVPKGDGQVVLFAFRPQFRGQPRGTYKLIFNAIMGSAMEEFPIGK